MVPFRGRLNFRQYMPGKAHVIKFGRHSIKMFIRGKPIRFGYKIWCLCGPDYIIWSHLSPTGEHTCFAGTATVNRSPHQHSSHRWLEAPARSSTKKLAATSGRRHWPICWCCPDRGPGSFDVEDATTLSWSSAAVSEWSWWFSIQPQDIHWKGWTWRQTISWKPSGKSHGRSYWEEFTGKTQSALLRQFLYQSQIDSVLQNDRELHAQCEKIERMVQMPNLLTRNWRRKAAATSTLWVMGSCMFI